MSRPATLVLAALTALTLAGCGLGPDSYNENNPDGQAAPGEPVVRTPAVVEPDLPYTTPPLVEPLPGPTGGAPGDVPTESAPLGPGEPTRAANTQ